MTGWLLFWVVLSTVALLVFLGWLGTLLARGRIGQSGEERPERSALEVLEDRYVRGQITAEEYKRRRSELP
jgi:uncharacterized membrane protein